MLTLIRRTALQPQPEPAEFALGDYIQALFEAFLEELNDEDLAEVATLAVVQQRLFENEARASA